MHSSDNLSHKVSFKSFKSIQQSRKRSRTNSRHETSNVSDSESNNLASNSNELLDQFNTKTKEIIKGLHELHFSTIDLRNKLNSGRVNNGHPIITQVTGRNNISTSTTTTTTSNQVRVDIYAPGQTCWWEIRGFLHKEMNLCIKAAYYLALINNEIYPPWTITFQLPPNLISNTWQAETIVNLRKTQAKEMLSTLSAMSTQEATECKMCRCLYSSSKNLLPTRGGILI